MSLIVKDGVGTTQTLRSFPDESGEQLVENVSWPIELAWDLAGRRFMQHTESSVGNGSFLRIGITTPITEDIILAGTLLASNDVATIRVFEGSTITGGTSLIMRNLNRTSSATLNTVVVVDPTVSVAGTQIFNDETVGVSGGMFQDGTGGTADGMVRLDSDTTYIFEVESGAASNLCTATIYVAEGI